MLRSIEVKYVQLYFIALDLVRRTTELSLTDGTYKGQRSTDVKCQILLCGHKPWSDKL